MIMINNGNNINDVKCTFSWGSLKRLANIGTKLNYTFDT